MGSSVSALFNKPTTKNVANISIVASNNKAFTTISDKMNKQITESIVQNTTYVNTMYSNTMLVDLSSIVSQSSVTLNIDTNQTIRSVQTSKISTSVVLSAVKESVSSLESDVRELLNNMLMAESAAATNQTGTTNAFGVAGSIDQHLSNVYTSTQNITNQFSQYTKTFVDNFVKDSQVSESVSKYMSKFEQAAKVSVAGVSAVGPVVINVNLSQFTASISNFVSEMNVASTLLNTIKTFEGFVIDSAIYTDAATTNTTKNTQTGTTESVAGVLDSATPWGVLGNASTKIIFAISVVLILFFFVFLGRNGKR